ncbi:DEAD/DEAH box helicase [Nitrospira sp. BLG_2]|uniref:DEAD/DEAH box helicase n=1 Tax=Nitrospira sp. BLG_2 TaxID=3397507 RepID=UPI003B9C55D1
MNRHVNAIAGRLSLRPPQRMSLEMLDRVTEMVPPKKNADLATALAAIKSEFPTVTDFEREFPSLCFALATGVGKTRLMGAFISYLHQVHGINHFFVLAPNLTIYNKLITDFTPNTPKYVFTGIAEFATEPPTIITGNNYESGVAARLTSLPGFGQEVHINIFNISKINSEVRGGKAPRIKRLSEYIGQSYFEYLAGLDDLVLIMDESHRYRASAGVRAINELKPVLGLELTATPFVESSKGLVSFKNVIYDYPLAKAMGDGFVKEPAVVTQKNFNPAQFGTSELEKIKLEDGVRVHENTKVELETYARQTEQRTVKPFMLIIARDTTHAGQLMQLIQSPQFFEGWYKDKVIQVDSSKTGAEEDEMVQRLLAVESSDEPTEIVIHVNMLKEGWDVTNLYTIVPLRAANARTLIEQSIGRGLRLPYGRRTGVSTVDRLNIIAHDRFQEIIDEANRPDSAIRLTQVILDPATDLQKTRTVVAQSKIEEQLSGIETTGMPGAPTPATPTFSSDAERALAQATYQVIQRENLPASSYLLKPEVQSRIAEEVKAWITPAQQALPGLADAPNIAAVVKKTAQLVVQQTIDIPRILVVPKGEVTTGFHAFTLDCSSIRYQPVERDLLIQHLRTNQQETLSSGGQMQPEQRLEDYVVRGLVDYDDISYDEQAELLYDLAGQVVKHARSYLSEDDTRNVLIYHQRQLAAFVYAQMKAHEWEKATGYDVVVSKGFMGLKPSAYTAKDGESIQDFRQTVEDRGRIGQLLFGGFQRGLYSIQKFDSDTERRLAVILDRDSQKWFRPAAGQFQISYKLGISQHDYQPDFVAETADCIYMLEPKAKNDMTSPEVLAKKDAAVLWCNRATTHALSNGGKPWRYVFIPHDAIAENMTLGGLVTQFAVGAS